MSQREENAGSISTLVSGALAGAIAKTVVAPLDRAKIIIIRNQQGITITSLIKIIHGIKCEDGWKGMWRGNSATVMRIIPYSAGRFFLYESIKNSLNNETQRNYESFIAGSMVGVASLLVSYPFDTVRSRMAVTPSSRYKCLSDAFIKMHREEGIKSFYRGFEPTVLGVIPYAGLSFFIFELCKYEYAKLYPDQPNPTILKRLIFGGIGGFFGTLCAYPFDVVRHNFQTDGVDGQPYKYKKTMSTFLQIYRNSGIQKGLFGGLSINLLKGLIANAVSFCVYDTLLTSFKNSSR